ncbi:MAG: hypothetical protein KAI64_04635 [Thermoplasmata archaeon]|nr:hypothetical protein [Thermoplasmata archaeon]
MNEESRGEGGARRSSRQYGSTTDVLTRRGGIFWGVVLLIIGIIWLLGALNYIEVNIDLILPLLVIIIGLWLLVTKIAR